MITASVVSCGRTYLASLIRAKCVPETHLFQVHPHIYGFEHRSNGLLMHPVLAVVVPSALNPVQGESDLRRRRIDPPNVQCMVDLYTEPYQTCSQ